MLSEIEVGPRELSNGARAALRGSRDGAAVVQAAGATFQEAVRRGRVYGGCSQSGVTSQAGLSGTTPTLTLYNPAGSKKNLALWYAGSAYTVAFATAGGIWLGLHETGVAAKAVSALGTELTATRNFLANGGTPATRRGSGQLLLAATASTPIAIALLGAGLTGAITTVPAIASVGRWFDGAVILGEDTAVSIQTGVASGASGQFCEFIWEELDA